MDDPELLRISLEDLTQGEIIGRGSFGTVIRALWNEEEVAVKFFQPDKELLDAFAVEANQLSRVNHRNIIRLFGASFQPPHVFLVMEYADSGSLYKVLHTSKVPYHSGHAIHWLLQTAKGVEYLHNLKPTPIAHRDLKSPNLLLVNGGMNLKLCDFGTACGVQTYMTNNKGSAAWMAPEVFEGNKYTEKCDIYSHGILTWEVLTRRLPFDEIKGNNCRILWAIHQGKRPPLISGCPVVLEDLMTKCWDKNPSVRPNMTKIVEQLSFIQKFFPSIENDPLQIEKFSSLKDEEELKEETGSYVSALTSLPSKSEGFYTPPELVDSDTDVIPPLPSMDPISLLNAPQELMKGINLWVDEDSGPIPSDIEVVRDRSSEDIVSPHPPSKDTFQFFEPPYRPNLYPYHGSHRYPLSDFRPSVIGVGASNLLSPPSGDPPETLSNHDSWHNNMPYESLSGRNYPSPSYFGKVSPQNLSSPHSMRRNNSKTTVTKDINGLFSVREDATEKSESFKKGHRRASSYGSSGKSVAQGPPESNDHHQQYQQGTRGGRGGSYYDHHHQHPSDLRRSYSDLSTPCSNMYDYYERDSIIDRAVELIEPDLRPVPPQPNCPQSMQIYHDHRQLASEYVKVKTELERLRDYKDSLEKQFHDEEIDESEGEGPLPEFANQEEVENYVRKQSERDSLLQFQDKLSKQLKLLKSTISGGGHHPSLSSSEENEWVIINE
uniref:Mitogenactivated protein kinase kinase kinase 7like [Apis florea] n=1 Tax=Lepeophtheirus salmonis TaxID=72036 RepID=A0A0K2UZJ2_LEPSM|nr:focal adhesion kinase 1-like isoform X3 [Lepeophtheirus salmonis]